MNYKKNSLDRKTSFQKQITKPRNPGVDRKRELAGANSRYCVHAIQEWTGRGNWQAPLHGIVRMRTFASLHTVHGLWFIHHLSEIPVHSTIQTTTYPLTL
jgi:hypothetical protein